MRVNQDGPRGGAAMWTLLSGAIDYAGLFPPAQLDMPGAVAEYASYVQSADEWALGRFVVPAARLDELAAIVAASPEHQSSLGGPRYGTRLSAILGADLGADVKLVHAYNDRYAEEHGDRWWGKVEAVEFRAATEEHICRSLEVVPDAYERYVEIPIGADTAPLLRELRRADAFAKVRTGGTTADAFPSSADLVRFLAACLAQDVGFKATAGLHHPFRGDYALSYEPGSALGRMYGFLNVFLATAFLRAGMSEAVACDLLEEQDPGSVKFSDDHLSWRGHRLVAHQLSDARNMIRSFGSCSFREPIDDLEGLELLT